MSERQHDAMTSSQPDSIAIATTDDGGLRAYAAVTTQLVEEARRRHGLFPTAAAAVGRTMTAAAVMGMMLKENQQVMVQLTGDGPLRQILAQGDADGNVRGYAANPHVHLPLNKDKKLDVAGAIGSGRLDVIKDLRLKEPYRGMVKLVSGEIAEDIAYYFVQSEQVPSAVALGVRVEADGQVSASGGLIVQALPGADPNILQALEQRLQTLQNVSRMVASGMGPKEILAAAFGDLKLNLLKERPLQFSCNCSQERFSRGLLALGPVELRDIIEQDGEAELTCHFCSEHYHFSGEDLRELLDSLEQS